VGDLPAAGPYRRGHPPGRRILVANRHDIHLHLARSLADAALAVSKALAESGLDAGRRAVSMIVGREVDRLDERGVTRATVETVAENLVDGIVSPLFFAVLGGAPLAMAYKMVNTLDSMVGYKNDRYLQFGRFAARMDDVANFIPARLSRTLHRPGRPVA
jgi:adenosylcobinamide-phosphate synthase